MQNIVTLEDAERRLRHVCAMRAFQYNLNFSEAEGVYYATADGQASSEYCEVKRASTLFDAMVRLAARVEEKYPMPASVA